MKKGIRGIKYEDLHQIKMLDARYYLLNSNENATTTHDINDILSSS